MPKLTVSRQEATSRIEEQLDKGHKLRYAQINSNEGFSAAQKEYYKWHQFNTDLLRRLFDTEEISEQYSAWYGMAGGGRSSFTEELQYHYSNIEGQMQKLESIKERLSLFDEPALTPAVLSAPPVAVAAPKPKRIFISHGRSDLWRQVQAYIEKDIGIPTLELAQEANRGRTVLQKLWEESSKCSFAVIVMTGDDLAADGTPRARENVMHEIGLFQGRYGLENVCVLHEENTNIPTNIHGLVYIPFAKGNIREVLGELFREIRAAFPV